MSEYDQFKTAALRIPEGGYVSVKLGAYPGRTIISKRGGALLAEYRNGNEDGRLIETPLDQMPTHAIKTDDFRKAIGIISNTSV